MAWAKNGTPVTLGSASTGMNISDTSSSIFNVVLTHGINVTSDCAPRMRFNTASGSVYSRRWSDNGGADGTAVSQTYQYWYAGSSIGNLFQIAYVMGIAGEEKLSMVHNVWGATAGAGTAPARTEVVSKWAETSSSITSFNVDSGGTYWDTDSNMSSLGSDLTPVAAIPFPSDVQVGSRAEITDTRKMYNLNAVSQTDTITKDSQSYAQNEAASSLTISSFTVGSNSNRILIVAVGEYNAEPAVTGITWNGSEAFTEILTYSTGLRAGLWYLINPTATTANVVITYASTAKSGAGVYSFYNVDQSSPIGATNSASGTTASPSPTITPTTTGSIIVDSITHISGVGATLVDTLTAGWSQSMHLPTHDQRKQGSQYSTTPTIGSANNMYWTSSQSAGFGWVGAEIKASTSLVNTWTEEGT